MINACFAADWLKAFFISTIKSCFAELILTFSQIDGKKMECISERKRERERDELQWASRVMREKNDEEVIERNFVVQSKSLELEAVDHIFTEKTLKPDRQQNWQIQL